MFHSTIDAQGRTTIPAQVRKALGIVPGDTLFYSIEGERVFMRKHPGIASLEGALASTRGKNRSFAQIRKAATARTRKRTK